LIYLVLRSLSPTDALAGSQAIAIVVDNRLGRELPATFGELVETSIRMGAGRMVFGTETLALGREARGHLELASRAKLADAVDRAELAGDGALVTFKRRLPPRPLAEEASRILGALEDEPPLKEVVARLQGVVLPARVIRVVRELERWRILTLTLVGDSDELQRLVSGCLRA
jgi:hypothetical protein